MNQEHVGFCQASRIVYCVLDLDENQFAIRHAQWVTPLSAIASMKLSSIAQAASLAETRAVISTNPRRAEMCPSSPLLL
jgi:hypothetical protein